MNKNNLIGIGFKVLNCFFFSLLSILVVYCSSTIPVTQILFIRVLLGCFIALAFLYAIKVKVNFAFTAKDYLFYLSRAFISFVAMILSVYAMQEIGVTETTALTYTAPFFMLLAAKFSLKEVLNFRAILVVILNIFGVLIILNPNLSEMNWLGVLSAFAAILLWVIYDTICKKQTSSEHYMLQTFYVCFFTTIIVAPFAVFNWHNVDAQNWINLTIIGIIGVANITSLFLAYSFSSMIFLAPFSFARIIFTIILSALLQENWPHISVILASSLIIIVNFYFAKHAE